MNRKVSFALSISILVTVACTCPATSLWTSTRVPSPTPTQQQVETPGASITNPPPPISLDSFPFQYDWIDRRPFETNLVPGALPALHSLPGASIYHLALSFSDPPNQAIGVEEIYYTNSERIPLDEVFLALFPNLLGGKLEISQAWVNDAEVHPEIDDWLMCIPFSSSLLPGETVTLRLEFRVEIPSGGGNLYYGVFGYNEGILSFAHGYPTILVHNGEGWNNQAPDLDGDPLFSDASFYLVEIDAPLSLTIVASGTEIERQESGERQQVLLADGPARDFYLAASGGLIRTSATWQDVTVNSYARELNQSASQEALQVASRAIETFSQRYGSYPYTEFDIAPIVTAAGGVEYPGMTAVSDTLYLFGDFLEIVVVHEVAHMWFYNLVGNDTLDQPWLDESLAQFATWQYFVDRYGDAAAQEFLQGDLQVRWDMASDPGIPIGLPVSAYDSMDYDAIIYGRGAFFFMALRQALGVEKFDGFMRDYVARYAWDISTTEGFKLMAEQHCGCDLTTLFSEWVNP